jgi:hypothetical protein
MNTIVKITVFKQNGGIDELVLPTGAIRWEIQGNVGTYSSVRFLAISANGSVIKWVEYGSGQWLKYEAIGI